MSSPTPTPDLSHVQLFSALTEEQLQTVLRAMSRVHLMPQEMLFTQGQPAERFYLVLEGSIDLFRLSEKGDEKVIDIIRPGQTFAEAVMFMAGHAYPVSARAVLPSELLSFENRAFRRLLEGSPETCLRLLATTSQRLHHLVMEIDNLTLRDATHRLAQYLLQEVPEQRPGATTFQLSVPKHLLASRLSIQPETLSRILARMRAEGLIEVKGSQIELRNIPALHTLLELP